MRWHCDPYKGKSKLWRKSLRFYLGTHETSKQWWDAGVPLFVSRRRIDRNHKKRFPVATAPWALDSGGFTELDTYHGWRTTPAEYVASVLLYQGEIGQLTWCAPQDWMCEPHMLEKTGLTVADHQRLTVDNFLELEQQLGDLVVPVLQGWLHDDYLRCVELYEQAGVDLASKPTVGLGTVCRRQDTAAAEGIVRALQPLRLHGFGVKTLGLARYGDLLASADSMSWSVTARKQQIRLEGHDHQICNNCLDYALIWRQKMLESTKEEA